MSNFEQLEAFKRALALMADVYRETESFPKCEMYGLTAQIRSASISVMSNLAEGEGRLTIGEYRQFLSHARGSLFEVEAQVIGARELKFLKDDQYALLRTSVALAARPLNGLIRWAQKLENSRHKRSRISPPVVG